MGHKHSRNEAKEMMKTQYKIVSHRNVTLLLQKSESLTPTQAQLAVRTALETCGYAPWENICLDLFRGAEEALVIAYPQGTTIHNPIPRTG